MYFVPLPNFVLIFFTSYDKFALEAIRYNPIGYLTKPLGVEEFQQTVQHALLNIHHTATNKHLYGQVPPTFVDSLSTSTVKFSIGSKKYSTPTENILYFPASGSYAKVTLTDGVVAILTKTLKKLERELNLNTFIRISREHLVNTTYIQAVSDDQDGNYTIVLAAGDYSTQMKIPIDSVYVDSMQLLMGDG